MRKLIMIALILIFSKISFAGNGSGTMSLTINRSTNESVELGSVHPSTAQPTDYVRMQTLTNERIIRFQYKPAESNFIQSYSEPVENISQQYLNALKKSASSKNWESIEVR